MRCDPAAFVGRQPPDLHVQDRVGADFTDTQDPPDGAQHLIVGLGGFDGLEDLLAMFQCARQGLENPQRSTLVHSIVRVHGAILPRPSKAPSQGVIGAMGLAAGPFVRALAGLERSDPQGRHIKRVPFPGDRTPGREGRRKAA